MPLYAGQDISQLNNEPENSDFVSSIIVHEWQWWGMCRFQLFLEKGKIDNVYKIYDELSFHYLIIIKAFRIKKIQFQPVTESSRGELTDILLYFFSNK